jgi:hypothetical protein
MGIAELEPRQLAPTVGTTGAGSTDSPVPSTLQQIRSVAKIFDTTVMTFESSIKIYNAATAKIFNLADKDFDSDDMIFDVLADLDFDLADMDFDLADMVFDSVPDRKFGLRHQEIRPPQEIRPLRHQEIRPLCH